MQAFQHSGIVEIADVQTQQLRDIDVERRHLVEAQRPVTVGHELPRRKIVRYKPGELAAPQSTGASNGPSATVQRAAVRSAGEHRFVQVFCIAMVFRATLEQQHLFAGARERNRDYQAYRTRADDNRMPLRRGSVG